MRATYPERRQEIGATLVRELEALLAVRLAAPDPPEPTYEALVARLADGLAEQLDPPSRAFAEALSSDRARPLVGLVDDLAEVLFLPRERRREYVQNREATPPYRVRKLLLEYAVWSWRLDELVGVLSKGFCASHCDQLPIGCCHILGYDLGLVPAAMLELQRLEAVRHGWQMPTGEDKCRYHAARGCVLALFKSPACIGYLCEPLQRSLAERYPGPEREAFLEALAVFRNCDLDRRLVFEAMARTVEAGRRMIAAGGAPPPSAGS